MSLLKKFNETGQEIGSENVPLDNDNLTRYVEQYGQERAEGYQTGMSDILKRVELAITSRDSRFPVPTHAMVRSAFEAYSEEQQRFMNTALANQIKEHGSPWQQGYIDSVSDFLSQVEPIFRYSDPKSEYYLDRYPDGRIRRSIEQYFKEKTILLKILQPTIKSIYPIPPN